MCAADCFNPRLPGGRRPMSTLLLPLPTPFQSTPSGGKATRVCAAGTLRRRFQSTPSGGKATWTAGHTTGKSTGFNPRLPGGRRPTSVRWSTEVAGVSIHAFRGEGDAAMRVSNSTSRCFNPRLPGGRRPDPGGAGDQGARFNPRLPGGRRRYTVRATILFRKVSIHAFRGEGDSGVTTGSNARRSFNPRLPGGRRPCAASG